jgi:hypothetical protein
VLGWTWLVPASLVLLGGLYAAELRIDDAATDLSAPAFAAGLLVTAELAYWSLEELEAIRAERGEALRRLAVVALLGVASLVVTATLLVLADAVRASGVAFDFLGAAAAVAALTTVVVLARRGPER